MVELYRLTLSPHRVAQLTGRSYATVLQALKRGGVVPPKKAYGPCYQHTEQIRVWAAEGLTLNEIARRVGSKRQSVRQFLEIHGIPFHRHPRGAQRGSKNPSWKGGRIIDKSGYVLVLAPDHPDRNRHGYVRKHRLVMEEALGRRLKLHEVVHHLNGDRSDNTPSNLVLYRSNADHLAESLKGKHPHHTAEGLERMRGSTRRLNKRRWAAIHGASALDDRQSRQPDGPLR